MDFIPQSDCINQASKTGNFKVFVEVHVPISSVQASSSLSQDSVSHQDKVDLQSPSIEAIVDIGPQDNNWSEIHSIVSFEANNSLADKKSNNSGEFEAIGLPNKSLKTEGDPTPKDSPTKVCQEALQAKQLSSAKRSLETNFFLLLAFMLVFVTLIILPKKEVFSSIAFSTMKGAMPILTTIVNFGTIRSVMAQYKEGLKHTLSDIFQNVLLQLIR